MDFDWSVGFYWPPSSGNDRAKNQDRKVTTNQALCREKLPAEMSTPIFPNNTAIQEGPNGNFEHYVTQVN
jgi:hypothetical protein